MLTKSPASLGWEASGYPGIDRAWIYRTADGSHAAYWRMQPGAAFPDHGHVGVEHVVVLEGRLDFGNDDVIGVGDVAVTFVDERHGAQAVGLTTLFVSEDRAQLTSSDVINRSVGSGQRT